MKAREAAAPCKGPEAAARGHAARSDVSDRHLLQLFPDSIQPSFWQASTALCDRPLSPRRTVNPEFDATMKPSQCLYSSQRALYRVFVRPTATSQLPALAALPRLPARTYAIVRKRRDNRLGLSAAAQVAAEGNRSHDPRFTTELTIQRSGRSRLPQDHEITDPQIMVHDNDVVEGPLRTQFVLTRVEPHESLRMVSPYVPATKETPQKFAVCRIVDKKAEFEKAKLAKAKEQEKKQRAAKDKELEVNWGIGPNDLQTKIGTLARLMEGPVKVTVKFGRKKGSKTKLEYADMEELVRKVREQISEMGAREHKPAEGFIGKTMMLHFASKHA